MRGVTRHATVVVGYGDEESAEDREGHIAGHFSHLATVSVDELQTERRNAVKRAESSYLQYFNTLGIRRVSYATF